ncbi:hypothetical protein O6H91_15G087000 [Diphasiastrum complanatum]|uniref:Uncharacterized protein n=1 Tax=Diphasiastrum complanatum TaxID=34168 RepID=A0ACC2BKK5_DIPCM|nr:hypothetical protein O6H91_15G087000 [Diphasiastrum complanatum]
MNLERLDLAALAVPPSLGGMPNNQQFSEDSPKKFRKPYTITKSRESWTDQEHEKFLEALQLFDRDWKKIESFVGTKSVIQIRSHAQKYFLKVQKNGTGEHVPPPRPKRKSAQPYPQKASKNGSVQQQMPCIAGSSAGSAETEFGMESPGFDLYEPTVSSSTVSAWGYAEPSAWNAAFGLNTSEPGSVAILNRRNHSSNSCSSGLSSAGWSQDRLLLGLGSHQSLSLRATPDFAEVYKFIGRVFDPGVNGHLTALSELSPIDRETVLLLMKNLVINISSPDFQEYKLLMASSNSSSTMPDPSHANGAVSVSCAPSQPAADNLTSFPGKLGSKQSGSNVDDNLCPFEIGHIPAFHLHSCEAGLQSPSPRQLSVDSGSIADLMSLPPLLLDSSPLPQLVDSTPWNPNIIPWGSSPPRSLCTVQAIS